MKPYKELQDTIQKLVKETKCMVRWKLFLRECGLPVYHFTVGELKEALKVVSCRKDFT